MKDEITYGTLTINNKEFQFSYSDFELHINLKNDIESVFSDAKVEVVFNFVKNLYHSKD